MTRRLSQSTVDLLPSEVHRPSYRRDSVKTGIVHLGIGAFHRAHQATIFDRLLEKDGRWGVVGASLRSASVSEAMNPQDGLYCVITNGGDQEEIRLIGAINHVIVAPKQPAALIEALAAPDTHIVTLTITEKGYLPDPSDKPGQPRSAASFIAAGLTLRKSRGLKPFTAISCDNLPNNGARLKATVDALCEPVVQDWVAEHGAFPATMVDRIVPATAEADIENLARRIRLSDRAMVRSEAFHQWVIEERFASERPDFESAGVQMASDVAPWEEAKIRLLNGAHSAIAYLGGLAGYEFVHDFSAWPAGKKFIDAFWDETENTILPPRGLNVAVYRASLMKRFTNNALKHRTFQIAMDGSQKIAQRLLAPISICLEQKRPCDALTLAVAAWIRWQSGRTDKGDAFVVDDPLSDQIANLLKGIHEPAHQVEAVLSLSQIFPHAVARNDYFKKKLAQQLQDLINRGARGVLSGLTCGH